MGGTIKWPNGDGTYSDRIIVGFDCQCNPILRAQEFPGQNQYPDPNPPNQKELKHGTQ